MGSSSGAGEGSGFVVVIVRLAVLVGRARSGALGDPPGAARLGGPMGHRCNYLIREGDELEIFYSHWGASSVPADIFWGPARAEAFIRGHDHGHLLDDVWGEGGVALDKDRRRCSWFGGEGLEGPLLDLFLRLMRALWQREGWTVELVDGMPALAEAVGLDPEPLRSPLTEPTIWNAVESARRFEGDGSACSVLRRPDPAGGRPDERVGSYPLISMLCSGAALVDELDVLPTLATRRDDRHGRGRLVGEIDSAAWIDPGRRELLVVDNLDVTDEERAWIAHTWPGWSIRIGEGPLDPVFAASGDPLPEDLRRPDDFASREEGDEALSEEEALARIARMVLRRERPDMAAVIRRILEERGGTVNPHALENPQSGVPQSDEAERLLALAVASLRDP